jgi:hypothetical protein
MLFQFLNALLRTRKLLLQLFYVGVGRCGGVALRDLRENLVANDAREPEGEDQENHSQQLRRISAWRFRCRSEDLPIKFYTCHNASELLPAFFQG